MKKTQAQYPLQGENPWEFWRLLGEPFSQEDWCAAIQDSRYLLAGLPLATGNTPPLEISVAIQQERQFGPDHWRLSHLKRIYYLCIRPLLPEFLRPFLRTILISRQRNGFILNWPIEDRFVRFQFEILRSLLEIKQLKSVPFIHFWPDGKKFSFVITHDIEGSKGQDFVREVANLEEGYGFRSSFNFIPEKYNIDIGLIKELIERGFEVGVHGLKHDGKLFSSRAVFDIRAPKINKYFKQWRAVGFRAPMTHRNPELMQALEMDYDLSFFDVDPFEPIPGGTLSIWPFQMGKFVELPYTLMQDHTLMVTLRETTPKLWLDKVCFIEQNHGMALINVHPDYIRASEQFSIYEKFLQAMKENENYWHALPKDIASWWLKRSICKEINNLSGATIGQICLSNDGVNLNMG